MNSRTGLIGIACVFFMALAMPPVYAQRGTQQSVPGITREQAPGQGTQLYISPSSVRVIKQQLNQQGFDAGAVDGSWDQESELALSIFQKTEGLTPTGKLNLETIQALGVPQVLSGQQQGLPGQTVQEQARGEGAPLFVSPESLREIEQELSSQGYDPGKVDGQWDPEVRNAIRNFEKAQGLEPTGNVNLILLGSLGMDQMVAGFTGQGGDQQPMAEGRQQPGRQGRGYYPEDRQAREGMRQEGGKAEGTGTPLYVSPSGVRLIQQKLNEAGYDTNGVDGAWGTATRDAIRNWQQANGLELTGNLNIQTADMLLGGLDQLTQAGGHGMSPQGEPRGYYGRDRQPVPQGRQGEPREQDNIDNFGDEPEGRQDQQEEEQQEQNGWF